MIDLLSTEELIIPATRYYIGRMTIAANMHAKCLAENWGKFSERTRSVLKRDIEEWIIDDDLSRKDGNEHHPLGMDCDREAWLSVKEAWEKKKK